MSLSLSRITPSDAPWRVGSAETRSLSFSTPETPQRGGSAVSWGCDETPGPLPLTDAQHDALVARARAGDAAAFTALYVRYRGQIRSYVYRMLADADEADDATADTFIKGWRWLPRARGEMNLSAWLHRIATNCCLDVLRRRQRLRWLPWEADKHDHIYLGSGGAGARADDDPERAVVGQETRVAVLRTLARMTPRHRRALILRHYEEMGCEEIGEVMGLSRSAVKSLLFRAREEFRVVWGAFGNEVFARRAPAGSRPDPMTAADADRLTDALADGLGPNAIGRRLGWPTNTVCSRIVRLCRRWDVPDRAALAAAVVARREMRVGESAAAD